MNKSHKFKDYKFIFISKKTNKYIDISLFFIHNYTLLSETAYGKNILLLGLKNEDLKIFYDKKTKYPITYSIVKDKPLRMNYEDIINCDNFFYNCIDFMYKIDNKHFKFGITKNKSIPAILDFYKNLHNNL